MKKASDKEYADFRHAVLQGDLERARELLLQFMLPAEKADKIIVILQRWQCPASVSKAKWWIIRTLKQRRYYDS